MAENYEVEEVVQCDDLDAKIMCDWCKVAKASIHIPRLDRHVCAECYDLYHSMGDD